MSALQFLRRHLGSLAILGLLALLLAANLRSKVDNCLYENRVRATLSEALNRP